MDPREKLMTAIASALLATEDRIPLAQHGQVLAEARNFAANVVRAMQPHYRLGLWVIAWLCLALAMFTRGMRLETIASDARLRLIEEWIKGPLPGIRECARLFLTLAVLAIYDSSEALTGLGIEPSGVRALERYYAGMPATV